MKLAKIAGAITFLNAAVFTSGLLVPIPAEQTGVLNAVATLKATIVPMPIGPTKTYWQIFLGTNLSVILLLIITAVLLIGNSGRFATIVACTALTVFAIIAWMSFFPVPAALGLVAALLAFFSKS